MKSKAVTAVRNQTNNRTVSGETASFFLPGNMKRFLVFILLLSLLITAEYYFLTEMFTQKRPLILAASLLVVILCLYRLIRFFKRSVFSS